MPRSTATATWTRRPRRPRCAPWRSTTRASTPPTASSWRRSCRSSPRGPSGSRPWQPSCPRRPRPSRTSTSRSCCASASSIGHGRAVGRTGPAGRVTSTFGGAASRFEVVQSPPDDGSTRARLGRLTLTHGVVETPQFMPVGTNATVKALSPDDLREVGASIILSNTYHLYLRPGHERIARLGGLHRFMDWDRPILTDSGGFQVVSLGDLRVVDEDGVTFRSHLDGSTHRFTPELAVAVQEALGSDVAVAFDQPVFPSSSREVVAEATRRTHRWAERSLAAHTRRDQAVFGIIQGGLEPDLRIESAGFLAG